MNKAEKELQIKFWDWWRSDENELAPEDFTVAQYVWEACWQAATGRTTEKETLIHSENQQPSEHKTGDHLRRHAWELISQSIVSQIDEEIMQQSRFEARQRGESKR